MEESALCLERESQTVLQGDVVLHWRQCSRRALQRRSWSLVCVLPHSSMLRYNSQLSGMRSRSFNHILSNAAYISQADVFFQGWKLAKRNVKKKSGANLCRSRNVLGGTHWFPVGGTFWQPGSSVKQGIHTQEKTEQERFSFVLNLFRCIQGICWPQTHFLP